MVALALLSVLPVVSFVEQVVNSSGALMRDQPNDMPTVGERIMIVNTA